MPDQPVLFFDGACKGNPGAGGAGWVIFTKERTLGFGWRFLDDCTNNVAEYQGLVDGLTYALEHDIKNLDVRGDSKLVVMQVKGGWKVNAVHLRPLHAEAVATFKKLGGSIAWVPREHNKTADQLSNMALRHKDCVVKGDREGRIDSQWLKTTHGL
jgi:ribonuclease HI